MALGARFAKWGLGLLPFGVFAHLRDRGPLLRRRALAYGGAAHSQRHVHRARRGPRPGM